MISGVGVDVGGTRLKFGRVSAGRVEQRAVLSLEDGDRTPDALVRLLAQGVAAVAADPAALHGVGLGIAGVLSADGRRVLQSPNLPWLDGQALPDALEAALGVPVWADNDANCVGWGEARAGAGRGESRQICLALGTGTGGSLVLDDRLIRGDRGRGAELGHLAVDPDGPPCGCGGRGCLEQYASQTGLCRILRAWGEPVASPDAAVRAIFARPEEPAHAAAIRAAGGALGRAVAHLHALFDVDCFVFAGGIAASLALLEPSLLDAVADAGVTPASLSLRQGSLGVDAGTIGAAALADAPRSGQTAR